MGGGCSSLWDERLRALRSSFHLTACSKAPVGHWGKDCPFPLQRGLGLGFFAPCPESVWGARSYQPGRSSRELLRWLCAASHSPWCLGRRMAEEAWGRGEL